MSKVIELLKETEALLEGHFLYSSGRHGNSYFQCARLMQYPEKAEAALAEIAETIKNDVKSGKIKITAVAGPALGGIIVAYELGRQLGLPAIFTERDDSGKMCVRRGFSLTPEDFILISEDVITTGKSSLECARALEEAGAKIAGLVCVVDRRLDTEQPLPWPVYSALKVQAENWAPEECELCKQGIPLVKPGSRKS